MDFTNFNGFVKKMVQKNPYNYNVPPGPSANPYGEARSAEFDGTGGTDGHFIGVGKGTGGFKIRIPEGLCRAEPERGPIVFTFNFIVVGNGTKGFKIHIGNPPF